jgi:hypothetical protein
MVILQRITNFDTDSVIQDHKRENPETVHVTGSYTSFLFEKKTSLK